MQCVAAMAAAEGGSERRSSMLARRVAHSRVASRADTLPGAQGRQLLVSRPRERRRCDVWHAVAGAKTKRQGQQRQGVAGGQRAASSAPRWCRSGRRWGPAVAARAPHQAPPPLTPVQDEVLIAGFGRRGHAVGDIPGVRFKVVKVSGVSLLALFRGKKEKVRLPDVASLPQRTAALAGGLARAGPSSHVPAWCGRCMRRCCTGHLAWLRVCPAPKACHSPALLPVPQPRN